MQLAHRGGGRGGNAAGPYYLPLSISNVIILQTEVIY